VCDAFVDRGISRDIARRSIRALIRRRSRLLHRKTFDMKTAAKA
jgi:hypothetical protein